MTKNDFLSTLTAELKRRDMADTQEIVSEYEQHIAFKMADGYSEEEIVAKLGDPFLIAAQFEADDSQVEKRQSK
jgi:uncharacterized membrane protein